MAINRRALVVIACLSGLAGCGEEATVSETAGMGAKPELPAPRTTFFPTVNIAPAQGWAGAAKPTAADGLNVTAFANDLDHPRMLHVLPNGDVLVVESNGPDRPDDAKGVKGWAMKYIQKRAGAGGPSANRVTLLRGVKADGSAELRTIFLSGLNSPFGVALVGNELFVANTDAIVRFEYSEGQTEITTPGVKFAVLPAGTINHHWTKDLVASQDGARLYVSVGSNSNIAENGIDKEERRAVILEVDRATGATRVFASGLRNANGLAWNPQSQALWAVINERDELGSDLVPDYMTSIKDGGFYGWPYSYFGQHVDARVTPQRPELVAKAIVPDYALGPHTGSLGLTFYQGDALPEKFRIGAFVGQHGSWNRKPASGYKVIFVPFANGQPSGPAADVLTGFRSSDGYALGRPVGVAVDKSGALLVADDVGNKVWRVTSSALRQTLR